MTSFSKWINGEIEQNYYTPDVPDIYRQESHYIFLADVHMNGKAKHNRLVRNEDYDYLGKAFTKSASYDIMILRSTFEPPTPTYFEVAPSKDAAFIYGELYDVSPDILVELDYYMGNNLMTKRKKVKVATSGTNREATAWTWLADPDYYTDPKANDRLTPYNLREYLWNTPVIAWDTKLHATSN